MIYHKKLTKMRILQTKQLRLYLLELSQFHILYKEKIANTFVSAILNSNGGPEGGRTLDLLHAMETLSQLRYRPKTINYDNILLIDLSTDYSFEKTDDKSSSVNSLVAWYM